MALARKHRRQTTAQNPFHRRPQPQLVVDHDVMARWMLALNLIEHLLLVHVDQHAPTHRFPQAGTLDLARLKHHVAVGQDHRRTHAAKVGNDLERTRIQALGEGVVDQEARRQEQLFAVAADMFGIGAVALQRTQIVGIAEF